MLELTSNFHHAKRVGEISEKTLKERWSFSHYIGAIDGKHVETTGCGTHFYNYKGTTSIVLLVVAGSNCMVTWEDVGINRRISGGAVLKRNKFG